MKAKSESNAAVASKSGVAKDELFVKSLGSSAMWIRSKLPVKCLRNSTSIHAQRLGEVLAHGSVAKRDPSRGDFFEVVVANTWIYFHVAEQLRTVYVVAIASLDGYESGSDQIESVQKIQSCGHPIGNG
jgi:hypothetical protein